MLEPLPWVVWQTFMPAVVDLTAYDDTIDYEFRDRAYANEFLQLNGDVRQTRTSA